jgi:translocation and assembly module TamB
MATIDPKPSRTPATAKTEPVAKPAPSRRAGLGRRLRRLFFWLPLFLFLVLVALAPSLISWTPIGRQLAGRFAPVDGTVTIESLSIGWFSPLSITGITARDPAGEPVAEVASVRGNKPLWALVVSRHDFGQFEIDQPNAHVVLRDDGSNLEDFLRPLLAPGGGQTPPVTVSVKVSGGQATIDDQPTKRTYAVQDLALELSWQGAGDSSLNLQTTAKFVDRRRTTDLSLLMSAEMRDATHPLGKGRVTCHCDQLPLDVLAPLVRRALDGAQLAGQLTVALDANWGGGDNGGDSLVEGQIDIADLLFAAPALAPDRLEVAKLSAPCRIVGKGGQIDIEQLVVDCDLGKLAATGSVNTKDMTAKNVAASLMKEPCQITGRLDLVRLAALFPHLLSLRPGTEITAGELNFGLTSQPADGNSNWSGTLDTSDLEAVSDGRPMAWKQPLSVNFRVRDAGTGPIVDKLECTSSFLRVDGSGTAQRFTGAAEFNLAQLATELGRFVDLAGYELAGTGVAHLTCQTDAAGQLTAQGDADVRDFALDAPTRLPWREARVTILAAAAGNLSQGVLRQIASASVRLETQSDQLVVELTQAVDNPAATACPVNITWQGDLAALMPRVEPWYDVTGWDLSGRGSLQAAATVSPAAVDIQQAKGSFEPLHVWGHSLFIDERAVEIVASGRWQRADGKIEVSLASLRGASWVARLNTAELHHTGTSLASTGGATLETDLATIGRWTTDPRAPAARQMAGQLSGKLDWSSTDQTAKATLGGTIDNMQVALPPAAGGVPTVWQEPQVTLAVELDYDPASDQLQISRGQLTAATIEAQASGKISSATQTPDVDLSGQIVADWARLAPLWRPYAGPEAQIEGHDPWPFSLRGRWTPGATSTLAGVQQMDGQATVSWQRANVHGLEVSHGAIQAVLKEGTLTLVPVGVEVNGGKVLLSPSIRLASQPTEIEFPRGPMLDHMELTSQHAGRALRFITPVLAGVTKTTGQFSISLQGGNMPLANPRAAEVAGQLVVHSVSMQPGPILQTLLGFAQQIEGLARGQIPFANSQQPVSLIRIENQTVDFKMIDGRVYHRGLQFTAGNVTITTKGSVGLDESLSVVAEIPMHAGLLGNNSKLKGVDSDTLQIPIEGTITHPKIDPRVIEKLTGAMLKTTTKTLLLNPLESLEKLVPVEPQQ